MIDEEKRLAVFEKSDNMDRPGLKKLLADARQGKFQVVVCYKYDRLSRNTKDFLHVLDIFDQNGVAFVSVTQPIDTTSSIGRLMRSILMDFAQFEREIISERTRDKMAAIVQKGRRAGGFPILGYDINWESKHLAVNEEEAKIVQEIFQTHAKTRSLSQTAKLMNGKGYRLKFWTTRDGKKKRGGAKFCKTTLQYLLRNPLYIGKIRHHDKLYPGVHKPIVPEKLFEEVGKIMSENNHCKVHCSQRRENARNFLLKGLVRCASCGATMTPHYNGRSVCYYRCSRTLKLDKTSCPSKSANADSLERMVMDRLSYLAKDQKAVERIVERSRTKSGHDIPVKRQEKAGLEKQVGKVASEIRNLVAVLAEEGPRSLNYRSVMETLSGLEAKQVELQERAAVMEREILKLEGQQIEADIIRSNLGRFGKLFEEMVPDERRRLAQLFLREVTYDGIEGKVRLDMRPLPAVDALLDPSENGSKVVKTGCPRPTLINRNRESKTPLFCGTTPNVGRFSVPRGARISSI